MSAILVTVMPFAGHVAPVTAVVAELIARGHDVRVYTGSRYVDRFARLGARTLAWDAAPDFDENNLATTFPQVGRTGPRGLLANIEFVFIRSGVGQVRDIVAEYQREPFDAIVGDIMSIGAGLASELIAVPWATLSILPLSLPSVDLPPAGLGLAPGVGGFGSLRDGLLRGLAQVFARRLNRTYREVRAEVGLPSPTRGFDVALYSPQLVAVTGAPSLEFPRSDLPSHFHFVGRLSPAPQPRAHPPWWADLGASDLPIVLVTQGTFNIDPRELLEPALGALSAEPVLVVATSAGADLPFDVPSNARVADFLPFDEVLPLCAIAITNGGWGGVLEALSHGVPLIVAGGDLDKPDIAARVGWSGVGIDLGTGHPSAAQVRKAHAEMQKDSYRASARLMAAELASLGGAPRTVDLIEELLP